jgi:alpha-galactosidase
MQQQSIEWGKHCMTPYRIGYDIHPEEGLLSLVCPDRPDCALRGSRPAVVLDQAGREAALPLADMKMVTGLSADDGEAPLNGISSLGTFAWRDGTHALSGLLELRIADDRSFLALRLCLINDSQQTLVLRRIELMDSNRVTFSADDKLQDLAFFSNGWQSWSYSGVLGAGQVQPRSTLRFIPNAAATNPGTPSYREKGRFTSEMFGVVGSRRTRAGLLCGFLSQREQFGVLEADLRGQPALRVWAQGDETRIQPGAEVKTDWLFIQWVDLDDPNALHRYHSLAGELNRARVAKPFPSGWCSWYHYERDISAQKISGNVQALESLREVLPLDLAQIDDGFQLLNGDWTNFTPGFPQGIEPAAREIRQAGMTPGLWLAPFVAGVGAQMIRRHPEYLLKNRSGGLVNAGFISNRFSAALDISYPPALEYTANVIRTAALEWGFPYLKLDFLYAGALNGNRHDKTRTRAQILRAGLEALRTAAGEETFLLGCGVPLGSAIGIFDGMRIGADTAASWKPRLFNIPLVFESDPQIPAARNAIQNTLTRAGLHGLWWANDPDCLLLRPDTRLTLDELRSHASLIALSGGALLISDDLTRLPAERVSLAAALLPLIGRRPQVLDWFDRSTPRYLRLDLRGAAGAWNLLAYFSWNDVVEQANLTRQDFRLDGDTLLLRSYWEDVTRLVEVGDPLWQGELAPHGCVLLAVRPVQAGAQYAGSDLHISQGLEVAVWQAEGNRIRCRVELGRRAQGSLYLRIPGRVETAFWQEQAIIPDAYGDNLCGFKTRVDKSGWLTVTYTAV